MLPWQTSEHGKPGLYGLYPGNMLTLLDDKLYELDDKLYDFGIGTLFIKIKNKSAEGRVGFVPADIIIGETRPADDALWRAKDIDKFKELATVDIDGILTYAISLPRRITLKSYGRLTF